MEWFSLRKRYFPIVAMLVVAVALIGSYTPAGQCVQCNGGACKLAVCPEVKEDITLVPCTSFVDVLKVAMQGGTCKIAKELTLDCGKLRTSDQMLALLGSATKVAAATLQATTSKEPAPVQTNEHSRISIPGGKNFPAQLCLDCGKGTLPCEVGSCAKLRNRSLVNVRRSICSVVAGKMLERGESCKLAEALIEFTAKMPRKKMNTILEIAVKVAVYANSQEEIMRFVEETWGRDNGHGQPQLEDDDNVIAFFE